MRYRCNVCGYVYDEADGDESVGIAAGTAWSDVGDDFLCPLCGVEKSEFTEEE